MLLQQREDRRGAAKFLDTVGTQLDSAKTERRDVLNRLAVVSAPSDCGIAKMNFGRRRRDGRVEVGEVRWRVQHFGHDSGFAWDRRGGGQRGQSAEKLTTRYSLLHDAPPS